MASTSEQARTALEGHLVEAEVVRAASRAQLDGGTMRLATRTGTAVGLGLPAGVAAASRADGEGDLEVAFANGLVIAVTDQRVVLLDVTAVSAKPREPVLFIDRDVITAVASGEKRVMLVKMTTITLSLGGGHPRELRFEIPKVAKADGGAVLAALAG